MKKCDTILRGTVITMDEDRRVYLDGYVAIENGTTPLTGRRERGIHLLRGGEREI